MRLKSCKFLLTALHCRHETSPFVAVVGWVFDQFHCTIHHVGMSLFVFKSTVIKHEKRDEMDVQSNRPGKLDYCEEDKLRLAEGFTGGE